MTDVVVTGGSGFLGRAVCEELQRRGKMTQILVGPGSQNVELHHVAVDVTKPHSLEGVVARAQCVIHCAGLAHQFRGGRTASFASVNAHGTSNVISAAATAGVKRFVLVSSVAVYGQGDNPDENAPCAPLTPYAVSKWNAEKTAQSIATEAGIALVVLRLATIYGPGDPGNIRRLIKWVQSGRFVWLGRGTNHKSLLYVTDAARACVDAAQPRNPTGNYNVVGETVTVHQIVDEIAVASSRRIPRFHIPEAPVSALSRIASHLPLARARNAGDTLAKWLHDDVYNGTKFARDYRFTAAVRLRAGIAAEVAALR